MARPKSAIHRNRQLNVALTATEFERVREAAQMLGMTLVAYARARLLDESMGSAAPMAAMDRLALNQLKRIGNNLNQMTRQLNALGVASLNEIDLTLRDVRELLRRMP